jgi:endo-1,4-beta-xylanase
VTVWGFTAKYSWAPTVFPGEGAACLYDENLVPKAAYGASLAALDTRAP